MIIAILLLVMAMVFAFSIASIVIDEQGHLRWSSDEEAELEFNEADSECWISSWS